MGADRPRRLPAAEEDEGEEVERRRDAATSNALASSTRITTSGTRCRRPCEPKTLIVSADHSFRKSRWRQSPPVRPEATHGRRRRRRGRRVEERVRKAWPVPSGSSARCRSTIRRFSRCSNRRRFGVEADVDEGRRGHLVARRRSARPPRAGSIIAAMAPPQDSSRYGLVALEDEEPSDPAVYFSVRARGPSGCVRLG